MNDNEEMEHFQHNLDLQIEEKLPEFMKINGRKFKEYYVSTGTSTHTRTFVFLLFSFKPFSTIFHINHEKFQFFFIVGCSAKGKYKIN